MRRKRTPTIGPGEPGHHVSSWAVALWKNGWAMIYAGCDEDGDEFGELRLELHRELSLRPWHWSPFDVGSVGEGDEDDLAPEPPDDPSHLRDFQMVRNIRRRLVEGT